MACQQVSQWYVWRGRGTDLRGEREAADGKLGQHRAEQVLTARGGRGGVVRGGEAEMNGSRQMAVGTGVV